MIYFWLKLSGRYDLVNISPRQTNIFDFLSLKKLVCSGKYEAELNSPDRNAESAYPAYSAGPGDIDSPRIEKHCFRKGTRL